MRYGCDNCRYCKCYKGDYWTPDDYECVSECEDITEDVIERAWVNGETWSCSEEQICPGYEEVEPEPDYESEWDKYADERASRYDD